MINLPNPQTEDTLTARQIRELARKAVDGDVPGTKVIRHFLANTTDSAAIASTASATNFNKSVTLSKSLYEVGRVFNIKANGVYSSTGTPTLIFAILLGSTTLVTFAAKTAINNASNQSWAIDGDLVVRSLGATGTLMCSGVLRVNTSAGVDTVETKVNAAATTANLNTAQALQINLTWSASDAANTATLKSLIVSLSDYA